MYREETIRPGHAPVFHPMHRVCVCVWGGNFPRYYPLLYPMHKGWAICLRDGLCHPHHPMYREEGICLRDCQVPMLCTAKGTPFLGMGANHHLPSSRCCQLQSDTHSFLPHPENLTWRVQQVKIIALPVTHPISFKQALHLGLP